MDSYIDLAKKAIESYVRNKKVIKPPADLTKELLERKAGAFVTLKKNGDLRGCIGTYLPSKKNLVEEIIANAISSATADPRFDPVSIDELNKLKISVDVLSVPEKVDSLRALDPKKYGIIVEAEDGRAGLLLPDLEGVDMVDEQISVACEKAGIDPSRDKFFISRFTVERHE
jgi:AmmeMemoRadiSam system protein A